MTRPEDITLTADDTKCVRCGRGFDPGEGHYGTSTVPGHFHSACLYHLDPPSYRAGHLAGLREAMLIAEKHRKERFHARDEAKAAKSPKAARDHESMAIEAGHIEASIRARIAALETENGK